MNLSLAPEVEAARDRGTPIVALESTLIAHGLPWPDNHAVAKEIEATVRDAGAIPATIAILDGKVCVGLAREALEQLARDGAKLAKAGASDLAVHIARGSSAATTASATAVLAARAGIRVFATGGIGGVHRGDTGDVSQDLLTLSQTPIAIVSSGAKAILDLPRTLEMLETLGVLVVGFRTSELPAFYTRATSPALALEHRADSATDLTAIARAHWELGGRGILVAHPIPESAALDAGVVHSAIERALAEAGKRKVTGKKLTPFLLAQLAEVTGGASIKANRALAIENAKLGAELAVALRVDKRAVGFSIPATP